MQSISEKIDVISHFWVHYACKYQTILKKLNWSEKHNPTFFADAVEYLTFSSELVFEKYNPKTESLLSLTGAIQMMYVQQDLLDELRKIFCLPQAIKTGYVFRQMRNELIGHPISWDEKGNLKSTVLWNGGFDGESIDYVKYASENNFVPERETIYTVSELLEEHKQFVNKQLDEIINKIKCLVKIYKSQLKQIVNLQDDITKFPIYLRLAQQLFEGVFIHSHAFKPEILQHCYDKMDEHQRYKYVIEYFIKTLRDLVGETLEELETGLLPHNRLIPADSIVFKWHSQTKNLTTVKGSNELDYILTKLVERKPVCTPGDLRSYVNENSAAMSEISQMEKYYQHDMEYFAAYEYLCFLLGRS